MQSSFGELQLGDKLGDFEFDSIQLITQRISVYSPLPVEEEKWIE